MTYTFSTSTASTSWLNSNNWTGNAGHFAGLSARATATANGANNDIAAFGSIAIAGTLGINFNTAANSNTGVGNNTTANGALTLGAIDALAALNKALTINSSSTAGTLTLTGVTLNTIANTIVSNEGTQNLTLAPGTSPATMTVALGNTTNNVIQVNGSGNITVSAVIKDGTGASNLTLTSTGTPAGQLILSAASANTFSGTTTVDKGTMNLVTAGALGATSGITVNSGGTLLLSGTAGLNRINDAATFNLNGGTFNTGGLSEGSASAAGAGIGALTLSANSTIDFGTGASILNFAGLGAHTPITGADLAILNWSGSLSGGGTDQLLFVGSAATFTGLYDQSDVSFNGLTGYNTVQFSGFYEIVPIPEPSTWGAGLLTVAVLGWSFAKKRKTETLRS